MSQSQTTPGQPLPEAKICPHLGIEEDPQTCLGYASNWNYCHHSKPISVIRMSQQRKMCLCSAYVNCPVFQSEQLAPLPVHLRGRRKTTK